MPRTKPHRFWPTALLILLPALVLAGLAMIGLQGQRHSVVLDAARKAHLLRDYTAVKMLVAMRLATLRSRVIIYPAVPEPGPVSGEEQQMEALAAENNTAGLIALRDDPARVLSSGGAPLRVLAAWHAVQADPAFTNARVLARLAIHEAPSLLSKPLLERLSVQFASHPEGAVEAAGWLKEWELSEEQRRAFASAVSRGELVPSPPPKSSAGGSESDLPPGIDLEKQLVAELRALGDREFGDAVNGPRLLQRFDASAKAGETMIAGWGWDGTPRVLFNPERLIAAVMEDSVAELPGDWNWASCRIIPANASLGHPSGVLLTDRRYEGFTVSVNLGSEEALLAPWRWFAWTVAGLISLALLSAALGLGLARRSLRRERRLGELKSQFVSSVSHELRAPVGSLRLMADALAAGKVTGEAAAEFHRLMASEGARLSALIENVLDFARIEEGRRTYVLAETDVAALVRDTVKLMTPRAAEAQQSITAELHPLPFVPEVDAGAICQALVNLLDNALKFSPQGTGVTVAVEAGPSRDQWSLSVTDRGPGIPAAERERIFERFHRLGNELRRETSGAGIGLAIVKHIAEGHGGTVRMESGPGGGSCFILEFPAQCAAAENAAAVSENASPSPPDPLASPL